MNLRSGALKIALAMLFTSCSPQEIAVPSPTPQTAIVQNSNPRFERTSPPQYIQGSGYRRVSIEEWSRYNTGNVYDEPMFAGKHLTINDVIVDGTREYILLVNSEKPDEKYSVTVNASGYIESLNTSSEIKTKFSNNREQILSAISNSASNNKNIVAEVSQYTGVKDPHAITEILEQSYNYMSSQVVDNAKMFVLYDLASAIDSLYWDQSKRHFVKDLEQKYPKQTETFKNNLQSNPIIQQAIKEDSQTKNVGKAIDIKTGKEVTPEETRQRLSELKDKGIQTVQKGVEQVIQKVNEALPKIELPKPKK